MSQRSHQLSPCCTTLIRRRHGCLPVNGDPRQPAAPCARPDESGVPGRSPSLGAGDWEMLPDDRVSAALRSSNHVLRSPITSGMILISSAATLPGVSRHRESVHPPVINSYQVAEISVKRAQSSMTGMNGDRKGSRLLEGRPRARTVTRNALGPGGTGISSSLSYSKPHEPGRFSLTSSIRPSIQTASSLRRLAKAVSAGQYIPFKACRDTDTVVGHCNSRMTLRTSWILPSRPPLSASLGVSPNRTSRALHTRRLLRGLVKSGRARCSVPYC